MKVEGEQVVRTATAALSAAPDPVEPIDVVMGRYRLERELGAGAMGVVHAAFDPDLERRIALKVLRSATATREAKERLMREARAMARLAHPNVVTVYEVGTAHGRDFVAMELIHGETLAAWLRSARRTPAAIIDAFVAAGRGLAAAHAAGVVHRDFKPSNVLRSWAGRIAVTDFGLAREAEVGSPVAFDTTLPLGTSPAEPPVPSSLAGLTMTGAFLGTPPYMAPEQWTGGAITPATDQFAYCVALWEALSGERPYRGQTREALRRQIMRGPAGLDASRVPRGIRRVLRRGLDRDPARRWPTMNVVLAQLERAKRGPRLAIAAAVIAAVGAWLVAVHGPRAAVVVCEPAARAAGTVWSPTIADELRAKTSSAHASRLDAVYRDWQRTRARACVAPREIRSEQLRCLDGALDQLDVLRRASLQVPEDAAAALEVHLVDPEICRKPAALDVPRLAISPTPRTVAAYALLGRSETEQAPGEGEIAALIEAAKAEPCARVVATLAFQAASKDVMRARALMADAVGAVDQCGDERLRADLRIQDIWYHAELPILGPKGQAALHQAEDAAARVMQPELAAALAHHRAVVAHQRGHWEEALRWTDEELVAYGVRGLSRRQVHAVLMRSYLRLDRSEPRDLEAIAGDVASWRPIALANHQTDLARQLDVIAAKARFQLGDVVAAHADLVALWRSQPRAQPRRDGRKITGRVVDPRGRPVAGATIAASSTLWADTVGIGLPEFLHYEDFQDLGLRVATSDATGHFVIDDATSVGVIAAQLADRRSVAQAIAERVTLVIEPTRVIRGKVDLGRLPHTRVNIRCISGAGQANWLALVAPVAPDGSFTLAGAPIGAIRIGVAIRDDRAYGERIDLQVLPASRAAVTELRLDTASSDRTLDVIVRSAATTPLAGAWVSVLGGKHSIRRLKDLLHLSPTSMRYGTATSAIGERVPAAVRDRVRRGDLVMHIEHARSGALTACAGDFGDLTDPDSRSVSATQIARAAIACKHVEPDTDVVELIVPPRARFE